MDAQSLADLSWPVLRRLMRCHTRIYRATGGRVGHHVPGAPPMLLLDNVGAKSGTRRTTPLAYVEDGRDVRGDLDHRSSEGLHDRRGNLHDRRRDLRDRSGHRLDDRRRCLHDRRRECW